MSRHRRQPSRSLPLDFSVVDGEVEPVAAKGMPAHVGGGGQVGPRAGRTTMDVAAPKPQDGQAGNKTLPPPASAPGGRAPPPSSEATGKKSCDDHTGGVR
ncbi:hypothetical protein GUJ93_ZPchr0007g4841 [Zizania palustris]|uniref:Uncharacterized protein n=1 Tax=Zizania palustris TaxID=103762 RepID=A0A8J5TD43_ZIZPA|nr:hypothetical protein GUJ93_ZPchr0007g4841 [Zizania palustris]